MLPGARDHKPNRWFHQLGGRFSKCPTLAKAWRWLRVRVLPFEV